MTTYRKETSPYNARRYGKPWIAKLDFSKPGNPVYSFGSWLGQAGDVGELTIEAVCGDVLAVGQKDIRKNRGGADDFGVVQLDGTVVWGFSLVAARDTGIAVRAAIADTTAAAAVTAE